VLVILATLCYAVALNIAVPIQQRYGSLPVMARMLALAVIWTTPLGIAGLPESDFSWGGIMAIGALGLLGTGLAFVLVGSLAGKVGSTRSSLITYVIPVVALALGVLFRGDQVSGLATAGVVFVIGGALLGSRREA